MKIKLAVSEERYEEIYRFLREKGIEVDESASLLLTEEGSSNYLTVRKSEDGQKLHVAIEDIIYIESYGHTVDVHTAVDTYQSGEPLYRLGDLLNKREFLRVSNSVIISKSHVKQIIPTFSMKFLLVMTNGGKVDVTRSYYSAFKEFFGI